MEKYELLRMEDLLDNPTPRIPICLCLDTSSSMLRIVEGETVSTGEQVYKDGRTWNVVSGGISALKKLEEGVRHFYQAINDDEVARYGAEICVVTFDSTVRTLSDYATVDIVSSAPELKANGNTAMGEGVQHALDLLEDRKKQYQEAGVDYYQPWLVLMTDGEPNGSQEVLEETIQRTVSLVNDKKLTIFPIGVGPEADLVTLGRFSPTRPALKLDGMKFHEFFEWLSQSVSVVSQSMPGDKIKLDAESLKSWTEI